MESTVRTGMQIAELLLALGAAVCVLLAYLLNNNRLDWSWRAEKTVRYTASGCFGLLLFLLLASLNLWWI